MRKKKSAEGETIIYAMWKPIWLLLSKCVVACGEAFWLVCKAWVAAFLKAIGLTCMKLSLHLAKFEKCN